MFLLLYQGVVFKQLKKRLYNMKPVEKRRGQKEQKAVAKTETIDDFLAKKVSSSSSSTGNSETSHSEKENGKYSIP